MADRENKQIEIVKRIEPPKSEEKETVETFYFDENMHNNESFNQAYSHKEYYHEEYEEDKSPFREILLILFGIITIGIMGYLGFNYLKEEYVGQTQNNNKETLLTEKKEQKEIKTYTEELAIKQNAKSIEENVIATLSAQKEQTKQQKEEIERVKQQEEEIERVKQQKEEIERVKQQEEEIERVKQQEEEIERVKQQEEEIERARKEKELLVIQKKRKKANILKYEVIKPRVIKVNRGDSLASIAKRFYGNAMDFKRIIRANPRIRSSKTPLHFGEKIIIPRKDNKKTRRYIIVRKGYTLAFIAKKVYGDKKKISKIIRANYNIKRRHSTIHIGQKIYVPK